MSNKDNSSTQVQLVSQPAPIKDQGSLPSSWLGGDAVPLRGPAERELEHERQERLGAIRDGRGGRQLPRGMLARWFAFAAISGLVVLAALAISSSGGGGENATQSSVPAVESTPSRWSTATIARKSIRPFPVAQARRRAALRAKREAARRRARVVWERRKAGHVAHGNSGAIETPRVPRTQESAVQPEAPVNPESPVSPGTTFSRAMSETDAENEFGFER